MRKNSTIVLKALLMVVLLAATTTNVQAAESWTAFYNKLIAYPTGAGQVYMSEEATAESPAWADEMEMQVKQQVENYGWFYAYANPADGWTLGGFSLATLDDNGQPEEFNGVFDTTENPGYITTYSEIVSAGDYDTGTSGDSTAIDYPLEPNNVCYAVFTHVVGRYVPGQEAIGTIDIDQPCNDIGDVVTLTATPMDDQCYFEKWTLNGETVSTDESITVSVTGVAEYVAHFTSDYAFTINFPETGGYAYLYDADNDIAIPTNVTVLYAYSDSLTVNSVSGNDNTISMFESGYNLYAGNPVILFGKGEATFVQTAADPDYLYTDEYNMLRWSGDEAIGASSLDATSTAYYVFDEDNEKFTLLSSDATIPAEAVYMAVPDSCYSSIASAPENIYLSTQYVADGVCTPKATATDGRIYNLQGIRQSAIKRGGIYIIDGKKILYRK